MKHSQYDHAAVATRALRRAAEAKDRARLHRLRKAARNGAVVANENETPMPPELGKVCWSVELGEASLNWNAGPDEMAEGARDFERALDACGVASGLRRHAARDLILRSMAANDHVGPEVGSCMTGAVMWLATAGEVSALLAHGAVNHCGFLILPPAGGSGQFTFRMIAGWRDPAGSAANDNAPADGGARSGEEKEAP